jgi:hypothetical protein
MSVVYGPTEWAVQHQPAANTQATIAKAADANLCHVCTSITVTLGGTAATAAGLVFNLRDGATGAGTILWSGRLCNLANTGDSIAIAGLRIRGTKNTAMTLESAAAPAANVTATVAMTGYSEAG